MALPLALPFVPVSAYGMTTVFLAPVSAYGMTVFLAPRRGPLCDDECCEDAHAAACHCPRCCSHRSFAFSCWNLLWREAVSTSEANPKTNLEKPLTGNNPLTQDPRCCLHETEQVHQRAFREASKKPRRRPKLWSLVHRLSVSSHSSARSATLLHRA
jgi:hypothetical protein